ncbi:phenylacetic acid degradation operon negative regulatory protein PaaX [Azorhizobium doebereinerae]|uniref:phenylacetic acid degradation operon negative regulatory protein PaaX n=1 Tax=Azorhizobium doebereinerae TaxID=281091 RepID=UPI0004010D94|nr:phenylacetic acid degradation operon negative regulatory protein PaaX [Azorhizobium doebereinerae]
MSRAALAQILDHLRAEPSRTWSIIITVYGDAIVPRGGTVWLGTLLAFFKALDISEGVVRTAMSRLASDGWLERHKVGRNSFYRLAEKGRETFREAAEHIYAPRTPRWNGRFDLLLLDAGADRDAARGALEAAGFGAPAPGVWIAPSGAPLPAAAEGALRLEAGGDGATSRALAARSWPLDATAEAYARFLAAFEPLRAALATGGSLSDVDAMVARVLLIHEYRRIVLRDPILPAQVLPPDWPGAAARALCADVYGRVLAPSERWLDQNAVDASGAPLPPDEKIFSRFKD